MVEYKLIEKNFKDIQYEKSEQGISRITICRPEKRNAFRPITVEEMMVAFKDSRDDKSIRVIILRGQGDKAFCAGGDQSVRTIGGYQDQYTASPNLNVLDLQNLIRRIPKPVIASVAGWAIGGGHVLHVVCDLTIAADNAQFAQCGPKVGSFDAGLGAAHLARIVGQKKAREIWFLCDPYSAEEAKDMGLVNKVVPLKDLEKVTDEWCLKIVDKSPTAIMMMKYALNATDDGAMGLQQLAGECTGLFYKTAESIEGKNAFLEKRKPDFSKFN